jgi:hypothetical protein
MPIKQISKKIPSIERQIVQRPNVRQKITPRKIVPLELKDQPPKKCPSNQCFWGNGHMYFHITKAAIKYFHFPYSKYNDVDFFQKSDLDFSTKPDFYKLRDVCVPEGTELFVAKYKGFDMPGGTGLRCYADSIYQGHWYIYGGISELGVPGEPDVPS